MIGVALERHDKKIVVFILQTFGISMKQFEIDCLIDKFLG